MAGEAGGRHWQEITALQMATGTQADFSCGLKPAFNSHKRWGGKCPFQMD